MEAGHFNASFRAHPRSRGEHSVVCKSTWISKDSSPLARGTQCMTFYAQAAKGLIPARAGNTITPRLMPRWAWAHPRPCGEHCGDTLSAPPPPGSSPPVRGARDSVLDGVYKIGLIPARAGSTQQKGVCKKQLRAHPRPCGEHPERSLAHLTSQGSSPPVRGARVCRVNIRSWLGLIPARAGSTATATL